MKYDAQAYRIRCIGHVINLSLHAFLLANSKEALQAVINAAENSTSENIETSLLVQAETNSILSAINQQSDTPEGPAVEVVQAPQARNTDNQALSKPSRKGKSTKGKANKARQEQDSGWSGMVPLRKLHNIAVLLRTSVLLYQSWMHAIGVALGIDNVTRWSSWFNVINVALKHRPAITFWLMENSQDLDGNDLEKDDWDLLQKTHEFLQPFKQGTLLTEMNLSTLSDAMMVLDILLIHCRKTRVSEAYNVLSKVRYS